MDRETAAGIIRARRAELEALGVVRLALFGSVARNEQTESSDVDVAVTLAPNRPRGLAAIGQLMDIEERLREALGRPVDVIVEPVGKPAIQAAIERDRFEVY